MHRSDPPKNAVKSKAVNQSVSFTDKLSLFNNSSASLNTPEKNASPLKTAKKVSELKSFLPKSVSTPILPVAKPDRKPLMHNEDLSPSEVSWDAERRNWQAYEYLCHVTEAKNWMERVLNEELPPADVFPASLQNGIALAKLTKVLRPELMKWPVFEHKRLQYRHTENITQFFALLDDLRIPQLFLFDMTDLYEKRNLPKVVYCIHAVSHYIAEAQKYSAVENLVGKLEFSEEQLENTEKTIEGHSLPNFKAMNRKISESLPPKSQKEETSPKPSSPESLKESDASDDEEYSEPETKSIKTRNRRSKQGSRKYRPEIYTEQSFSDEESEEEMLQPRRMRRNPPSKELDNLDIKPLRRSQRSEPSLRDSSFNTYFHDIQHSPERIFSPYSERGRVFSPVRYNRSNYRNVSSMTLLRKEAFSTAQQILQSLEKLEPEIIELQALCRASLLKKRLPLELHKAAKSGSGEKHTKEITQIQSIIRGNSARTAFNQTKSALKAADSSVVLVQALIRSKEARAEFKTYSEGIDLISKFQAFVRGQNLRRSLVLLKQQLREKSVLDSTITMQAVIKSHLFRRTYIAMASTVNDVVHFQGLARGVLVRRQVAQLKTDIKEKSNQKSIINVQSAFRGTLLRSYVEYLYTCLGKDVESVVKVQSVCRQRLLQKRFNSIRQNWQKNVKLMTAIQGIYRSVRQKKHYCTFLNENPSFESVKQFVFLIEDNNEDYELEKELEKISRCNNEKIMANEKVETSIHQLDMKVSLLGKNGVNLDEIALKYQKLNMSLNLDDAGDVNLARKSTRDRVEHYEALAYILQTRQEYTKQLMKQKPLKPYRITELIFSLFGGASNQREQYFLLRALESGITESQVGDEENSVSWEIVSYLNTDAKSTEIRKQVLLRACSQLKLITDQLLEYDPHLIYEALTGGGNLSPEDAIREPTVRSVFVANLQTLRNVTSIILQDLLVYLDKLPFHILYLAKKAYEAVLPTSNEGDALSSAAQVVISQFVHPSLLSADSLELVDTAVGNTTKNLLFVSRIVHQIGVMIPFANNGTSDVFLQPLNVFIEQSSKKLAQALKVALPKVPSLNAYYNMGEGSDYTSHERPTLRISVGKMLAMHSLCYTHLNSIAGSEDSVLRKVMEELGPVPRDARELADLKELRTLKLTLNPKYCASTLSSELDGANTLLEAAQRCLGYVLQVHTNCHDVLSVLLEKVTLEDEHKYNLFLDNGNREKAGELGTLSFRELKYLTLEKFLELESLGTISRKDGYQALINKIALDIRNKGMGRERRVSALAEKKEMMQELDKKGLYLRQRLEAYTSDVESALKSRQVAAAQLNAGKKKGLRFLNKEETVCELGQYKSTAEKLFERGVLMRLRGYSDRQRKDVMIAVTSYEVAKFQVEITYKGILLPNGSFVLTVDELLTKQYHGHQYIEFLEGSVQFGLNRLIKLVFKKFFAI